MVTVGKSKQQKPARRPVEARVRALEELLALVKPIPEEWLEGVSTGSDGDRLPQELKCEECTSYMELITAWKKALKWTPGLDHALSCMLASIASTKSIGDQLWLKVISPASSGKSVLCEALSVSRKYVYAKDTFTGLTSGYQSDRDGEKNYSMVSVLDGKTLIINDGDTLLQLPNLNQVISQLRAFYGRNLRAQYKNMMSRNHEGISTTIILCGTSSLRALDSSELGERFLDCVIMEEIDDELEDAVLWRVANRAAKNLATEMDGKPETRYEPELAEAMQLTGGYVEWLRENAIDILSTIDIPEKALRQCTHLGKFVAHMRARPSDRQEETAEREFGARLVSQHIRLAGCLALALNSKSVDNRVMRRVRQIALDTSRGRTLRIVKDIYESEEGSTLRGLGMSLGQSQEKVRVLLRFLSKIGVVKQIVLKGKQTKWVITDRMLVIYEKVMSL